ncbi:AAA family ATPase [Streptomyces echinatus]|uniref:AAA family ATPase n=1 Tax=Streptomyces echinatus TaxID=67293 RepID=UPI0037B41CCC
MTMHPLLDLAPGTLLVAVGPGGAGKSTFAATAPVDTVVCLDSLRREIGDDAGDQSVTPAAVARQNALLERHLTDGATVFLDSTNVESRVRTELVKRALRHRRPIVALRFLPGLDTCRSRNRLRPANRQVPGDVLTWQYALAEEATPSALLAEGFTAVYDVHPQSTGATVSDLPAVRFACITDPTTRHVFFCATTTETFDDLVAAYEREEDLTVQPWEFTDPRIIAETRAWVADAQRDSGRPPMVMVGSIEDGQWVNWNLPTVPRPPVPSF